MEALLRILALLLFLGGGSRVCAQETTCISTLVHTLPARITTIEVEQSIFTPIEPTAVSLSKAQNEGDDAAGFSTKIDGALEQETGPRLESGDMTAGIRPTSSPTDADTPMVTTSGASHSHVLALSLFGLLAALSTTVNLLQ